MRSMTTRGLLALALLTSLGGAVRATMGQITAGFTYQGELRDAGAPVDGEADVAFTLFDAPAGGLAIGSTQTVLGVAIAGGKFAVTLNAGGEFGPTAFNGQRRWLEIAVRHSGGEGGYVVLSPRQELTASPHAGFALNSGGLGGLPPSFYQDAGNLVGQLSDSRLSLNVPRLNAANSFGNAGNVFSGSGAGLTALNAANITTGILADARLSNNVATRAANQTFSGSNTFTGPNVLNNSNNTLAGNGAGITAINASSIATGVLADARLSNNVATRAANQTFSGSNTFTGPSVFSNSNNTLAGNGAAITAINASSIATGSLADARLSGNVAMRTAANTFSNNAVFNTTVGVGSASVHPNFRVQTAGGSGVWKGGIASGGLNSAIVLGELNGVATIGGHNDSLTAWGNLSINPGGGNVGIGTTTPATPLQVATGTDASLAGGGYLMSGVPGGLNIVIDNNEILARSNGAASPLYLNQGGGHVVVPVLQITGGSDVAEPYCIAATAGIEPRPGMVVAIDPANVGKMRVVSGAYDRTVAGIISGANGIKPGLTLTQSGSVADGDLPVASIGRVWCWCDADAGGEIVAGDMLTTSDTVGHAMKVTDHSRSQGATLGKAMSSLKSGKGLVLVLVSLQ